MSRAVAVASDEGLGGVMPFAGSIREQGRSPLLVTGPAPAAQLASWREAYDAVEVLENPYDPGELAAAAQRLADGRQLVGLFSCYDGLVLPAARAAAEIGLPHPAIDGLERCRNKHLTRQSMQARSLPVPAFALMSENRQLEKVSERVGFPAVIKPLNGLASHLVRRVEGPEELLYAYRNLTAKVADSFPGNYSQPLRSDLEGGGTVDPRSSFLVERQIEGDEYAAELVVRGGQVARVALFRKFLIDSQGFLECGFTTAVGPRQEDLWRYLEESVEALGVDDCVAHAEVIDAAGGPLLVEMNAGRPGGQILVRAVRDGFGVDLLAETLAVHCADPRPGQTEPALELPITTLSVFPPHSGLLTRIDGLDAALALPGVRACIPFCGPGDWVDVEDKEFFAVNLLLSELDPAAAAEVYERARDIVRFRFAELPEAEVRADPDRRAAIVARSRLLGWLRARLVEAGFLEVQTPMLHAAAECGYVNQHETKGANGQTLYLRTDPEEYLKRYLTAGFDAVFELSCNVRGEHPDDDHLQEFTSVECYRKGWSFEEALEFCWTLLGEVLAELRGSTQTTLRGVPVDFGAPPAVREFRDAVIEHAGIDVALHPTAAELLEELSARGIWEGTGGKLDEFRRTPLEWLLDEKVLPAIQSPTFVTGFPRELGMSARERDDGSGTCLRAELYLPGGWELAHLYENLTEPAPLRQRYEERARHRTAAGLPPVPLDGGLMASAELGMPSMSGLALGVDRLLMLVLGRGRIGEGLLFPEEGFEPGAPHSP